MTDDFTDLRDRHGRLEGRVTTLERTVADQVSKQAKMETVMKQNFAAQKLSLQALADTQSDHGRRLSSIDGKLANIETWVGHLNGKTDKIEVRLTGVEVRLTNVEVRLTNVEGRLTGLESRMEGVEGRLTNVEVRLTGVEGRLSGVESRLTGVEIRLGDVEEKLGDLRIGVHSIIDLLNTHLVKNGEENEGSEDS